jgi:hypothetical protein
MEHISVRGTWRGGSLNGDSERYVKEVYRERRKIAL